MTKERDYLPLLALFVLLLDQVTKFWASSSLPLIYTTSSLYPYGGIGVFKDFFGIEFSLVHATNTGAAWGMFSEQKWPLLFLRIVLILFLLHYYSRQSSKWIRLCLILIIAGALGNVLDVFIYGHVIDMFHFILFGYDYPVFNVADLSICIGVFLYLASSFLYVHDSKKTAE